MKKLLTLLLVFGLISPVFASDLPKAQEAEKPKDEKAKGVEFAKVNDKVSEALCQKMQKCAPQKMATGACLAEVKGTFQKSYNSIPKEKQFEVSAPDLDLCVQSIQNSSCDEIKAAQTLKGCDFIQQLPPTS